jgi:1,2-dihydroxy-3-keto-5-methylthiopentene dioxygenase
VSRLRVHACDSPAAPRVDTIDGGEIARHLGGAGIRFERWQATADLPPDADGAAVLAAYRADVDRLTGEGGYRSVDVVRMRPDSPNRDAARAKFLDEHTHADDEVRFFVEGAGVFFLHIGDDVYVVRCERGDLIGVPASTPHWFDMGPRPRFTVIRLFRDPEGWVARFMGTDIAARFSGLGD